MSERRIGELGFADGLVADAGGGSAVLERMTGLMDWAGIEQLLGPLRNGAMGAPGYPALMLFKALVLQRWYALSDPALEEGLKDRLSFRRFTGLALSDPIPDHATLWRFRESLKEGLVEQLFAEIGRQIEAHGFVLKQGTLIDASLIPAAVNRPPRPEGEMSPGADGKPASKLVQSEHDPDAGWARKAGVYHFGYKLHAAMDKTSRIVRRLVVTPANINESAVADELICGDEAAVYADKAYDSHARSARLEALGIDNRIMRRGHPKRPLTKAELARNADLAKVRGAIEPLFALIKNVHGLSRARYRGLKRNACAFHLAAIAINLKRWAKAVPA